MSSTSSLADMACSIRQSIMRSREPAFVENYMSVASHLMLTAVNGGQHMFFAAQPGHASVNSNMAYGTSSSLPPEPSSQTDCLTLPTLGSTGTLSISAIRRAHDSIQPESITGILGYSLPTLMSKHAPRMSICPRNLSPTDHLMYSLP